MRLKPIYTKILVLAVLAFIAINQIIWMNNMYKTYLENLYTYANQSLEGAILKECTLRGESQGGISVYTTNKNNPNPNDTARYFMKEVQTEAGSLFFQIDKYDPYSYEKIIQFLEKEDSPIHLETAHSIFEHELSRFFPLKSTYVEYLDLENDSVINRHGHRIPSSSYLSSDTIVMDIASTIGLIAHIEEPESIILRKMTLQLVLSLVLILFSVIALFYLIQSFSRQWREERLRQEAISAMTHEFKRPLTAALSFIQVIPNLLAKNDTQGIAQNTEKTELELNKLDVYIKRIQQISDNEKKSLYTQITMIELTPFFEEIVNRYRRKYPEHTIDLSIETERQFFGADLLHFSNVMDNLIENAIKYSDEDLQVMIRVMETEEKFIVQVIDNGIGIGKEDLRHIFERFYRSQDKKVRKHSGFGLGLTYAKSVIVAHEGEITVESTLDVGSTFTISLNQ